MTTGRALFRHWSLVIGHCLLIHSLLLTHFCFAPLLARGMGGVASHAGLFTTAGGTLAAEALVDAPA